MDEHRLNPGGRAGEWAGFLQDELSQVCGMQAVSILAGVHRCERGVEVESVRNRPLNDVGVHVGIGVERLDGGDQILLRAIGLDACVVRSHSYSFAGLVFLLHIACTRAVIPDEDGSQSRNASLALQFLNSLLDVRQNRIGDRFSFEQLRGHRSSCKSLVNVSGERPSQRCWEVGGD